MDKILIYFFLFATASSCMESTKVSTAQADDNQTGPITFTDAPDHFDAVFYNVENLFDTHDDPKKKDDDFTPNGRNEWTGERYEKKLNNLARVFEAMKEDGELPALIGLAEVENEGVLEDLADKLLALGSAYAVVHEDSRDMRGIDMGLLYRKDIFELEKEKAIRIRFADKGYNSRDILYFKGRLLNGESIHVLLNHWPSRREGQKESEHRRLDAARSLRNEVDELLANDGKAKILILGDFNDYPDNKSVSEILGAAHRASEKNELNNLAYPFEMKGKGTYPYKGDWGMLDQAIVSGSLLGKNGLHVAEKGLEIFERDFMMYYDRKYKESKPNRTYGGPKYYGGYSDHLPIILHFDLNH